MADTGLTRVLFVCTGNICRSPTAEGVFRQRLQELGLHDRVETDSVGTHGFHVGSAPDRRSQAAARQRGIDISDLRARQFTLSDFAYFDYILAMDQDNLDILLAEAPAEHRAKVHLFMDFARDPAVREVPDPYYGGDQGFERVFELIENATTGLIGHLQKGQ
ncbi:MAG: low molecular weight protein-tyrosine-phosphatase [Ectothiorhodospiraceae bacterium]